jgi:hypothetical protein
MSGFRFPPASRFATSTRRVHNDASTFAWDKSAPPEMSRTTHEGTRLQRKMQSIRPVNSDINVRYDNFLRRIDWADFPEWRMANAGRQSSVEAFLQELDLSGRVCTIQRPETARDPPGLGSSTTWDMVWRGFQKLGAHHLS